MFRQALPEFEQDYSISCREIVSDMIEGVERVRRWLWLGICQQGILDLSENQIFLSEILESLHSEKWTEEDGIMERVSVTRLSSLLRYWKTNLNVEKRSVDGSTPDSTSMMRGREAAYQVQHTIRRGSLQRKTFPSQ